jgi:TRADD-N domain-containing protein
MAERDADQDIKSINIAPSKFVVGGDIRIASPFKSDLLGDRPDLTGGGKIVTKIIERQEKEVLSGEQALGRIADAFRLNLDQVQLNMNQARKESSQFFRTTLVFSGVAFAIILGGIGLMLAKLVTVGIVTTAASVIPEAGALLLFNKDRELRKTIETYHDHILDSQEILTMVDIAETIEESSAKDAIKQQIILAVLKVHSNVDKSRKRRTPTNSLKE